MIPTAPAPEELHHSIRQLQETFDHAFALPRAERADRLEEVLVVEVGGRVFGVRAAEVAGIAARPRIVGLPGAPPRVLGLTAIRGTVLPVLGLAAFVGVEGGRSGAWIAWLRGPPPLALAMDGLLGLARAAPADFVAGDVGHDCSRGAVRIEGVLRPLVDMSAVATLWARGRSYPVER